MSASVSEIVKVAQAILSGEEEAVWGCRRLCNLLASADIPDAIRKDRYVLGIIGFASETDDYPAGPARQHWDPEKLKQLDAKRDAYIARSPVVDNCRHLIELLASC